MTNNNCETEGMIQIWFAVFASFKYEKKVQKELGKRGIMRIKNYLPLKVTY